VLSRSLLALTACLAVATRLDLFAAHAAELVDDAGRHVVLPERVTRVFAAGAPAEVLLYTLVPEMMVGRNQRPSEEALALLTPQYRSLPSIATLPEHDDARYDGEFLALRPEVYVDYGTVDDDYVAALETISARTEVPGVIFDGGLGNIPAVYRRLGAALGAAERGERTAAVAERILTKYRGALAQPALRVYLACSPNGATPCLQGQGSAEAAAWLGAVNVAGSIADAPRRPWTVAEIAAAAPTVVLAVDAARLRSDADWQAVEAVAAGRVHAPPSLPFNWGPRPPSVNRLLGLVWMAYALPGRAFDDAFYADVAALFEALYHVRPSSEELRELVERR
jgi:iron complex transport system substrate-binding protein